MIPEAQPSGHLRVLMPWTSTSACDTFPRRRLLLSERRAGALLAGGAGVGGRRGAPDLAQRAVGRGIERVDAEGGLEERGGARRVLLAQVRFAERPGRAGAVGVEVEGGLRRGDGAVEVA